MDESAFVRSDDADLVADFQEFVRTSTFEECERLGIQMDWSVALKHRNVSMCMRMCTMVIDHPETTRPFRICARISPTLMSHNVTDIIADQGATEFLPVWCRLADAEATRGRIGTYTVFWNALRLHRLDYVHRAFENGLRASPYCLMQAVMLGNPTDILDAVFHATDRPPLRMLHELIEDYRSRCTWRVYPRHDKILAVIKMVQYLVSKIDGPIRLGDAWRMPMPADGHLPVAAQLRDLLRRYS